MEDSSCKTFTLLLLLLLLLFPLVSPSPSSLNSDSILISLLDSQFSDFSELIEKALLLEKLERSLSLHNLTILAPTNHALDRHLHPQFKLFLLQPNNLISLQSTLLFHFIPLRIPSLLWPDLPSPTPTLLAHQHLLLHHTTPHLIKTAHSAPLLHPDSIVRADGVIHAIDRLLIPKSVQQHFNTRRALTSFPAVLPQGAPVTDLTKTNPQKTTTTTSSSSSISIYESLAPAPAPGPGGSDVEYRGEGKVNDFIKALIQFGGYKEFVNILVNKTSLGSEIGKLVKEGYSVTVLAPYDEAMGKMRSEEGREEMMYLHMIPEYQTEESMYNAARRFGRVRYETLVKGQRVEATEVAGTVRFGGEDDAVNLFEPDIYTDGRISVQGIDGVLVPLPQKQVEHTQKEKATTKNKGRTRGKLMEVACWVIEALGQVSKIKTCQYQE